MLVTDIAQAADRHDATSNFDCTSEPFHGPHSFRRKADLSSPIVADGKASRAARLGGYVADMAKAKTSGRGAYIGDVLKARMLELGMDAAELAALTGFSETHIINLRNDNKRASLDAIQVIAPHIGMVVAALIPNGGVEPLPEALGTVAAYGFVDLIESDSMMPATLVVMAPCFEWQAGDVLWFRRGGYEAGKYLIVRGIEGKVAIVRAFDEGGKRWLDTGRGDTMQYRPAAHTVVGVIARSVRDH